MPQSRGELLFGGANEQQNPSPTLDHSQANDPTPLRMTVVEARSAPLKPCSLWCIRLLRCVQSLRAVLHPTSSFHSGAQGRLPARHGGAKRALSGVEGMSDLHGRFGRQ